MKIATPMSTITSRKVAGILVSTALALQCTLGGEPGNGTTPDSTTNSTASTSTAAANGATTGSAKNSGKTAKTDNKAEKPAVKTKTYWLTQHVDVTTDSGVTGLPIGTKVTYVGPGKDGLLKVKTADDLRFDASKEQLTDDPAQAAELAQQEAQKSASQAATLAEQQQAAALATAMQPPPTPMLPPPVAEQPAPSSSGPLNGSSLDKGAYNVVKSPKPKPTPKPPPVRIVK